MPISPIPYISTFVLWTFYFPCRWGRIRNAKFQVQRYRYLVIFPFQEASLLSKMWDIQCRSSLCNLILVQSFGKFLNPISVIFGTVVLDFRNFCKTKAKSWTNAFTLNGHPLFCSLTYTRYWNIIFPYQESDRLSLDVGEIQFL